MITQLKDHTRQGLMAPLVSVALLTGVAFLSAMPSSVQAMSKKPTPPPGPSAAQIAEAQESVHGLAQGCYAIQSPTNGKFMNRFHQGGAVDDGLSYQFSATTAAEAGSFFFKPTSYYHYMLTDQDGRYLASHLPNEISAGKSAGEYAQ